MSQIPPQICPQCGTYVEAGNRFCQNCGTTISQEIEPTAVASGIAQPLANPNNAPSSQGYGLYPPAPSNPALPGAIPPPPSPHTHYNSGLVPPPAPIDPYNSSVPFYSKDPEKKKRSPLLPIIITLIIIVLAAGGTGAFFLFTKGSNSVFGPASTPTPAASQTINLTATYASDQITFTNIQQATKFSDDTLTQYSYNGTKNYVRLSFNEKQTSTSTSYFDYLESFSLKTPNGSTVKAQYSEELTGPEQGVQRPNWVDFPGGSGPVDLTNLTIILGTSDEAQMTIPLKSNADVSKYQPKTTNLNSRFKYAGLDMTIQSATLGYSYNGQQAKTGKEFLTINLEADNNQDAVVYLDPTNFLRLKTSNATVSPDDFGSGLTNFDFIDPHTTGITGTAVFDVTPSPDGKYTLIFQKGDNIDEVDQTIQLT